MRLASFNVENLFDRAKVLNQDSWSDGKKVLDAFAKLNKLLGEVNYTATRKSQMVSLLKELGLAKSDKSKFVILRRNKGGLLKRPKSGGLQIVADGRADWVGSLELLDEPIDEQAMRNTARVMDQVKAHVLAVIEAENRPALAEFNKALLTATGGTPYRQVMLIDGNDERGIDVGLLTRNGYEIGDMRSHVDDRGDGGEPLFSRDCPEFEITTPAGGEFLLLINHFKSKGFGTPAVSDARRKAQAARVKKIYEERIEQGYDLIAVVGDFNDTPDSDPLKPLLKQTDLKDAFEHPQFDNGGYPGTFGLCNAPQKIDYLLLSPKLFAKVEKGGVFRKGMWPGKKPPRWETFAEVKTERDAASDHAAVWVDLDI